MNLYFDTNVSRFVRSKGEVQKMRALLAQHDCELEASASNLFETFAIPSISEQRAEILTLVRLADGFEEVPVSWLHAELRAKLRRKRPSWIRHINFTRKKKLFLRGHAQNWTDACELELPDPGAYAVYSRDSEEGIARNRSFQKGFRPDVKPASSHFRTPDGTIVDVDMSDPNVYWRADCLMVWYQAIERKVASSRDYADWMFPYLEQRRAWREMQFIIQLLDACKAATGAYPPGANTVPVAALTPFLDGPVVIGGVTYSGINGYNTDANDQQLALDPETPADGLLPTYPAVPSNDLGWNNPYFYNCPGDSGDYDLICFGADGQPGGTDKNADISASSQASLVSTWYEYTPINALDIGITTTPPNVVPPQPSPDIG